MNSNREKEIENALDKVVDSNIIFIRHLCNYDNDPKCYLSKEYIYLICNCIYHHKNLDPYTIFDFIYNIVFDMIIEATCSSGNFNIIYEVLEEILNNLKK